MLHATITALVVYMIAFCAVSIEIRKAVKTGMLRPVPIATRAACAALLLLEAAWTLAIGVVMLAAFGAAALVALYVWARIVM